MSGLYIHIRIRTLLFIGERVAQGTVHTSLVFYLLLVVPNTKYERLENGCKSLSEIEHSIPHEKKELKITLV